ncbi:hypothetical protein KCP73_20400 [Salmonella enterica subsp. enterica]|nr:hypothetical protein KCP73_20400 [Salmonella enterica subsp. enterica]
MKASRAAQIAPQRNCTATRDGVIHFLIFAPAHFAGRVRLTEKHGTQCGRRFRTRRTVF